MGKGQLVLVLQDTMRSTEYTELVMTVVNGLEFRNFSRPVLRVRGCAEVPTSLFTPVSFVPCYARVFVRVSLCRWCQLVSIRQVLARLRLPSITLCGINSRQSTVCCPHALP